MLDMNAVASANPTSASFRIFSGQLTPFDGSDGKRRLRTIASSSVEDLSGDVVTPQAIQRMAASAQGMTIFRNHSYKVPHDILGSVEKAEARHTGTDGNGKPIWDLLMDIVVLDSPDNDSTYRAVEAGVQLGTSIGAQIPQGAARKGENGGYIFDDLRLLEASIVGIPQNPRSWVQYATKAARISEEVAEETEDENTGFLGGFEADAEPDVEKGTVWMESAPDGAIKVTVQSDPPATEPADDTSKEAEADIEKDADPEIIVGEDGPETVTLTESVEMAAEPELTDEADLTESASDEPADEAGEESPAQEVGETAPESAELVSASVDDEMALLNDTVIRSADVLADLVKTMTRERVVLNSQLADTERQRDEAIQRAQDAETNLRVAKDIVQRIANTPLGRKAVIRDAVDDFSVRLSGIYSPSILKMLERHEHES